MSRPKPTLEQLREAMAEVAGLSLRERRQAARRLGYLASELAKSGDLTTLEDIALGIDALALGAAVHSYPQAFQLARARLMKERRALSGGAEPVIAFDVARTVDIEVGGLIVADAELDLDKVLRVNPMHRALNDEGAFFIGFGGDGAIKVRIRVHDSGPCEPQSGEFLKLREATPTAVLKSVSGQMVAHGCGRQVIPFALEPRTWAVSAYGLGMGRSPQCLVVIAPVSATPPPLEDTPELMI